MFSKVKNLFGQDGNYSSDSLAMAIVKNGNCLQGIPSNRKLLLFETFLLDGIRKYRSFLLTGISKNQTEEKIKKKRFLLDGLPCMKNSTFRRNIIFRTKVF